MSGPGHDERTLLEELAARARDEASGETPTPEEVQDYLAGRLPPEDEERVARHLVADPELARAAVDLADLAAAEAAEAEAPERGEAADQPADLATAAGWRELRGRLEEGGARRPRWRPVLAAAAALLILLTAGLAHRVVVLQRQLDRPLADLRSAELVAGARGGDGQEIPVAAGERLLLTVEPAERCATYEAVLEGPGGGDRWSGSLTRDRRGQLTLLIPGEPGDYTLALSGCEPLRPLQEHRFRIVRAAAAGGG